MGELFKLPQNSMSKGFLIAVCIIIAIALIVFPLIVSYKAQKNKKDKS